MFSRFFIDRPILASVPSILVTLLGLVAVFMLPVAQYPEITPPTVQVACNYPGANAQVVADTVAAPIEQQVNGVEDMLYMSSQSANDGSYTLTVTFKVGTNLNMAQVLVQNRVALASPVLPDVVKQVGVTVKKRSPDLMFIINLVSPDGRYDLLYLSNYAVIQLQDALTRIEGVGDVIVFGQRDYSMRVWLDPDRLTATGITAGDVVSSLREQNVQVAAGQIGQQPASKGVNFQYTMSTLGRLTDPEQFGDIIVKKGTDGRITRLRDVGRVELGAKNEDRNNYMDDLPSMGIGVFQLPGSNALATAERVKAKMRELKKRFPQGLDYHIYYDTTPYISESIREVFQTLFEAVALVAIVVLVFLQNWRSALIPLIAVPVAIIGTFAAMALMGFSLNTLSLFGLVLAIGIVVDDAIVVVEATAHHIEQGMMPRAAAHQAMEEVSAPVLAIGLVLTCVFLALRFHFRDRGPVLPPVRLDHRRFHRPLHDEFADPQPGPVRGSLEAAGHARRPVLSGAQLPARLVLQTVQQDVFAIDRRLYQDRRQAAAIEHAGAAGLRGPALSDRLEFREDAARLHSPAGPGLPAGGDSTAGLGLAGAHGRGCRHGQQNHPRDQGRRSCHQRHGLVLRAWRERFTPGVHVHHSRSL